ncbi:MAG TPA: LLM class F420-dependent oxidoreductase [Candidatus Binataceae bacterium]|nr:LLM class F420-dependent oxidoreductase [Candidatus Binataceae bacterium]
MRLGITLPFDPFINRHLPELVRAADRSGYTDAWSYESFGSDAFSPINAAAMLTDKLRFGSAIVPVFTRSPELIAMCAITTQQLTGGRFILGLGVSTPNIVQQWMNVPFRKPNTQMRETVEVLRAIFRGEKVTYEGKVHRTNGFRLDIQMTEPPPPIYVGAQGSQMLRIAGEIGDGVIVNFVTPETLPAMLDHTREGMRATGKDPARLEVGCRIIIAVDEDHDTILNLYRRSLTAYVTVPQYNKFFREIGYEAESAKAIDAWNAGDRKTALASITDEMVEKIFVFGSPEKCAKRLRDYERGGITSSALQFNSLARDPEQRRTQILRSIERLADAWRASARA